MKAIDDFTAEKVNIELTLAPDAKPAKAIKALYAFTSCESAVTCFATVIHKGRPVGMDVEAILKENTSQLLKILKQELTLSRRRLLEDIHAKTLVQIFVENRIYKDIEECKTYPDVQTAVMDGLQPFAGQLERPITKQDIEMLLGIRIRRISRFDLDRSRKEIDALRADLQKVEKQLEDLRGFAVHYLKGLLRDARKGPPAPHPGHGLRQHRDQRTHRQRTRDLLRRGEGIPGTRGEGRPAPAPVFFLRQDPPGVGRRALSGRATTGDPVRGHEPHLFRQDRPGPRHDDRLLRSTATCT